MCGVIGFYSPNPKPKHLEAICRLYQQSKIRGLHAFGFSVWEPNKGHKDSIRTVKYTELLPVLKEIMDYRLSPPELLIGHARYSTSGDWKDFANNQPVHINGISMVFNGVITQASKKEYEKEFNKEYITENDGEIFSRKVLDGEDWVNFVSSGKFSFAGIFLRNGEAYAIRNKNRPLYKATCDGGAFIASTRDIFVRAGGFSNIHSIEEGIPVRLRGLL